MPKKKIVQKCPLDKFYTKDCVAKKCIDFLLDNTNYSAYIEPSAGGGAFSRQLPNCTAYDIKPEQQDIIEADYLSVDLSHVESVCVVGNPPFGSRNKLTKDFIKNSTKFDGVGCIAFILPECFTKLTMQSVFPVNWKLTHQLTLPEDSFTLNGEDYHVPCVFQVWEKGVDKEDMREKASKPYCEDFELLPPSRKGEANLFSFGAAPHNIIEPTDVQGNNRGYYIKSFIDKEELLCRIKDVDWKEAGASSVSGGVFWVSKDEYIKIYCNHFNKEIHYV